MVKTTVYLPEDLKTALSRAAAESDCSEAELIRDSIRRSLESRTPPKPRIPLIRQGLGDPTASERVDELLQGFGER